MPPLGHCGLPRLLLLLAAAPLLLLPPTHPHAFCPRNPCSLAAFGLAALYRLASIPGSTAAQLATAGVLAYAPLLLLLTSVWPHGYIQHRQPLVAAMKVYAAFVATLLPAQHAGAFGRGGAGGAMGPAEALLHAGASFATQLMLHALGERVSGWGWGAGGVLSYRSAGVCVAGGLPQAASCLPCCAELSWVALPHPAPHSACRPADHGRLAGGLPRLRCGRFGALCRPRL